MKNDWEANNNWSYLKDTWGSTPLERLVDDLMKVKDLLGRPITRDEAIKKVKELLKNEP